MKHLNALAARAARLSYLARRGHFVLLLAGLLPAAAEAQTFSGRVNVPMGSNPTSVAVGDVNGDGTPDLLTANLFDNAVSVRLNDGASGFGGGSDVSVGRFPSGVTVGDMDGNSTLDLLTANRDDNTVSVRLNDGIGGFGGGYDLPVGAGPVSVVVGDVNGDSYPDLLVANQDAQTVSVRLNGGVGNFSGGYDQPVGGGPALLVVGDVDGDGDLDLLTANTYGNTVSVCLNDGRGNFYNRTDVPVGAYPVGVAVGDVDGDGDLDLLAANQSASSVSVRLNDGAGNFGGGSNVSVGSYLVSVAVGDVDGDGDLDLFAAGQGNDKVGVRLNNGAGSFGGGIDLTAGDILSCVVVRDVNNDGKPDLLAANQGSGTVSVFRNTTPDPVVPPALTAVAPNPGGLGQSITLTGTNLANPTTLTINGANALDNIISSSGTSLVVRVPVTAAATGNVVIGTAGGTASRAFAVMPPPGNALAFDGVNDYIAFDYTAPNALRQGGMTLEAWVYFDGNTGPNSIIRKTGDYGLSLSGGKLRAEVWTQGGVGATPLVLSGSVVLPANRWTHVAATWDPNSTAFVLYVNGVADAGAIGSTSSTSGNENLNVGRSSVYGQYFKGALDELRIYSKALTAAQVRADLASTASALPSRLVLYLNFDQGTPATASTGDNTGLTALYDLTENTAPGTLTNFALASGNTTSNFVQSYALVVPTATTSTARTATGFTVNWTAPAFGTATSYLLDVATTPDFSAPIAGSPFATTATSYVLTGLNPASTYYYRVRALNSALAQPDQGAYSNTVSQAPALPVELTAFTATTEGPTGYAPAAVRLAWATASEKNSRAFAVERSADGRTFAPIGTVAAAGSSSSARSYELTDIKLPTGTAVLYYRLKQVDADGTFSYSPVRAVALKGTAEGLALYPNPAHGGTATLTGTTPGTVATVYDALGRPIATATADAAGTAALKLPAGLPAGVYVVRAGSQALRLAVE